MILHWHGQSYWSLSSHMIYRKSVGVLFKHVSSGVSEEESVSFREGARWWTLRQVIPRFHREAWESESNAKKKAKLTHKKKSLLICWDIMSPKILRPLSRFLKSFSQPWFQQPFFECCEQLQNTSNESSLLKCYFDYSSLSWVSVSYNKEYLTNTRANTYIVVEL